MIRKLMDEYEKWTLTINTHKIFIHWSGGRKFGNGKQQKS
jgi:hypothetical protein